MNYLLSTRSVVLALALSSCVATTPSLSSIPPAWVNQPSGGAALKADWWKVFGDPALDDLIARGWSSNPEIDAALYRVEAARADRFEAMAALFPKASVSAGFREGREKNRTTVYRPDDLEPWTAAGEVSWEIDLTGKRSARLSSARSAEAAAYTRWRGVRLLIATEIALARFEVLVLGSEISILQEQSTSETKALEISEAMFNRGLISSNDRSMSISSSEELRRELSDVERRKNLAKLRLDRLCGGNSGVAEGGEVPSVPIAPSKSPAAVWGSRPDLVTAESDVRAAFAIADASKLDLLPTLSFGAGGDLGADSLSRQLKTWELSAGPRLDIPIWDPGRIAEVKRTKANAWESAASYRATALKAVEEIEGAYVNFGRRRGQLTSVQREAEVAKTAWIDARAKTGSGEGAFTEENSARRRYSSLSITEARLRFQLLDDYLALVRALGG